MSNRLQSPMRPSVHYRIRRGVAEHVEEDGLGEGVELGEGGAALGPQRVRFVQDRRNPPLLGEGWNGELQTCDEVLERDGRSLRAVGAAGRIRRVDGI